MSSSAIYYGIPLLIGSAGSYFVGLMFEEEVKPTEQQASAPFGQPEQTKEESGLFGSIINPTETPTQQQSSFLETSPQTQVSPNLFSAAQPYTQTSQTPAIGQSATTSPNTTFNISPQIQLPTPKYEPSAPSIFSPPAPATVPAPSIFSSPAPAPAPPSAPAPAPSIFSSPAPAPAPEPTPIPSVPTPPSAPTLIPSVPAPPSAPAPAPLPAPTLIPTSFGPRPAVPRADIISASQTPVSYPSGVHRPSSLISSPTPSGIAPFGPIDRTGCVSSVGQQPTSTGIQPISTSFGPVNRDGCVSSVTGTTPVAVSQPEVFRGHILDPEVAAIPRVPDDSQQVTTGPQQQPVTGFQPEILANQNATTNTPPQPEVPTPPQPEIQPQQQPEVPTPPQPEIQRPPQPEVQPPPQPVTGFQPEIQAQQQPTTFPQRRILTPPELQAPRKPSRFMNPMRTINPPERRILTPPELLTGSRRRFRTARRSYF